MGEEADRARPGDPAAGFRRGEERTAQRFALLAAIATRLLGPDRPARVLDDVCRRLMTELECDVSISYLLDESADRLTLVAGAGVSRSDMEALASLALGENVCGQVAASGLRLVVGGAEWDTAEPLRRLGLSAFASFPLEAGGRLLGTLALGRRSSDHFEAHELAFMEMLAAPLGAALERWREAAKEESSAAGEPAARGSSRELARADAEPQAEDAPPIAPVRQEAFDEGALSEDSFRSLAENAPDLIVRFDRELRHCYVNPAAARAAGLPAEAMLGRTNAELGMPTELVSEWDRQIRGVLASGRNAELTFAFPSRSGVRSYEAHLVAERDREGAIVSVLALTRDVTERARLQRRLHETALFPEQNPSPALRVSRTGVLLYANPAARGLLAAWRAAVGRALPAGIAAEVEDATRNDRAIEVEVAGRVLSLIPVPIAGEAYVNLYGRDVTERQRIEQALRESEQRFAMSFEYSPEALVLSRPDDGRIEDVNATFLKLFGYDREEVVGRTSIELEMIVWPPERQAAIDRLRESGEVREFELDIRTRSGSVRRAMLSMILVPIGGQARMLTTIHDITERKRAEEALRESESFYRQTLESIPGMVFTTRPDGYCDYQSQQWADYTGVPTSEHLGDGWSRLLHPDDRPRAMAAWQSAVAGQAPYDLEYRVRRGDGEYEWFKVRGRPIRNAEGEIVRWFGVALNADALVRAEDEVRRSRDELERRVRERTAEVERAHSHLQELSRRLVEVQEDERRAVARELHDEAGQALTALRVRIAALERDQCVEHAGMEAIRELQRMVDGIMEDLHALSVRLRPAALDRLGIAAALRQLAAGGAGAASVDLDARGLSGATQLPLEVETTVYRVVQEALTNVARHSDARRASVVVVRNGDRLVAVIEDDGHGFDVEAALASGRLGLVGMRERAQLLGGGLEIESAAGTGTTVRLELPLRSSTVR